MDEEAPPVRQPRPSLPAAGAGAAPGGNAAANARRSHRALESALRSGPFELALRLAIADRGLNLESLRRRLEARGIRLSLSTLSYWQRGVRRPERAQSLRALHAIEDILGLPRSALVALLGPPRPRGRRREAVGGLLDFEDTLGPERALSRLLAGMNAALNSSYEHISMQGDRWMRADRSWSKERVRRIVASRQDGLDRFIALSAPDAPGEQPPLPRALYGCRLGRVRADPATGLHAVELLFDTRLRVGQLHVFDYEYRSAGPAGEISDYQLASRQPIRELVLRVHFDPAVLPARCYHVRRGRHDAEDRRVAELQPGLGGAVQLVSLGCAPGIEGIHWEWE